MNYIIKILNRYVVAKEIKIPYPTIAELSLGAIPAIAAIAPAVIIGAIAASSIDTVEARLFHPKILQTIIAIIGAKISLTNKATLKGFISSFGSLSWSWSPAATSATGTVVRAKASKTFVIVGWNSTPTRNRAKNKS